MKKILFTIVAIIGVLSSCDDTTDTLGSSLTSTVDNLTISVDTFNVKTRSIKVDSVLCRSSIGFLGKIKDPETGAFVTGNYMTQFTMLENYRFPDRDSLLLSDIECDSVDVRLYFSDFYGDSLTTMKATIHEMLKPMEENVRYYSNFDPIAEGYVRNDGLKVTKTYSLIDYNYSDSVRGLSNWTNNIRIRMNQPYTAIDGTTYNNYGTYIMRRYYAAKENKTKEFENSYNFIHNICPGFYITNDGGIGSMANIRLSQLNLYFRTKSTSGKSYSVVSSFYGTEEVLQGSNVVNNKEAISNLVKDNTCTYIKSPAGIFTEVELPVLAISEKHENDTINSAKLSIPCISSADNGEYTLKPSSSVIMVQKDSLDNFFDNAKLPDFKMSYISNYSSSDNCYTFNNIASLVQSMHQAYRDGIKKEGDAWVVNHPDWNKVVIVPITSSSSVTSANSSTITKVSNNLTLSSVKLVGGPDNPYSPLVISVVYSKFQK